MITPIPVFNPDDDKAFRQLLNKRIDYHFRSSARSIKADYRMLFKAAFWFIALILSYIAILNTRNFGFLMLYYIGFGCISAFLIMNVAHDASHNAFSRHKFINNLLSGIWYLFGISAYLWKIKHNQSHHPYTNVCHADGDISQSSLLRLNPEQAYRRIYRFQHIYAFPLYCLLSLFLVFYKDFQMFTMRSIGPVNTSKTPFRYVVYAVIAKLFYTAYTIFIPWYLTGFHLSTILGCFLMMHMFTGFIIAIILTPPHINSIATVSTTDGNGSGWFRHQIESTIDYAASSRLMAFFCGGLNTHVAHHLFPSICHIHYREITPIIQKTAAEFGICYHNLSIAGVMRSHIDYLQLLGSPKQRVPENYSKSFKKELV